MRLWDARVQRHSLLHSGCERCYGDSQRVANALADRRHRLSERIAHCLSHRRHRRSHRRHRRSHHLPRRRHRRSHASCDSVAEREPDSRTCRAQRRLELLGRLRRGWLMLGLLRC